MKVILSSVYVALLAFFSRTLNLYEPAANSGVWFLVEGYDRLMPWGFTVWTLSLSYELLHCPTSSLLSLLLLFFELALSDALFDTVL